VVPRRCQLAGQTIASFEVAEKWNELSKWFWFLDKLKTAKAKLPSQLFEDQPDASKINSRISIGCRRQQLKRKAIGSQRPSHIGTCHHF
jgi:hypothetical protein